MVHLQANGFEVTTHEVADLPSVKAEHAVPRQLEGRPDVIGIAVPGMPIGSPGMESPDRPAEHYEILTFDEEGQTTVYERR